MAGGIIFGGESQDATYLNTVRQTITALDGQRLTAVNFATIGALGTLAVAATAYHYYVDGHEKELALAVLAFFSCIASIAVSVTFLAKVWMFDSFIGYAVDLALQIEEKVGLRNEFGITHRFEKHRFAGKNGRIFTWITFVLGFLLCAIAVVFAYFIWDNLRETQPYYAPGLGAAAVTLLAFIFVPLFLVRKKATADTQKATT